MASGNVQLLKRFDAQEALRIGLQPLIRGQAHPGKSPLPEIAEAHRGRPLAPPRRTAARWQTPPGQRPGAGPGDAIDGDAVLLERVQHAQVRDAARKSAAQRHAHLRRRARAPRAGGRSA